LMVLIHEQAGEHLQAIERYRRIVDAQPGSVVALNNLAYRLATVGKNPKDALPFATAAAKLAPQDPAILDTLAWTQHLLGDNEAAVKTTAQALKFAPNHPEIRLHAAIIYAAAGARAVAEDNLRIALKLNPGLADSPDVAALRATLEKLGASK
jgi:cellulose synthase operon protein C